MKTILKFTYGFSKGILDSISFIRPLKAILSSPEILRKTLYCMLVNGVIFLGSMVLHNLVIQHISGFIRLTPSLYVLTLGLELCYYAFWIFPLYIISLVLTSFWVQDIFDEGIKRVDLPKTFKKGRPMAMNVMILN